MCSENGLTKDKQWIRDFTRINGRAPTRQDWDYYCEVMKRAME